MSFFGSKVCKPKPSIITGAIVRLPQSPGIRRFWRLSQKCISIGKDWQTATCFECAATVDPLSRSLPLQEELLCEKASLRNAGRCRRLAVGDGKRRCTWLEECDAMLNGLGGSRNFDRNRVWT